MLFNWIQLNWKQCNIMQPRQNGRDMAKSRLLKTAAIVFWCFSDGGFFKYVLGRNFKLMRHRIFGHPVANMTPKIAKNDDIGVICGVADDIFWCLSLLNPDVTMHLYVINLSYRCKHLSFCSHSRCKCGIRCMYIVKWQNFCLVSQDRK